MIRWLLALALLFAAGTADASADLFAYLRSGRPAMVAYVATGFDPRRHPRGVLWPVDRLHADLLALRPAFDGLVLYDYQPEITPGIVEQAAALGFRAVLLGIWDPRSQVEIAGTADIVRRWGEQLALGVVIGNEGINDNRYEIVDVTRACDRLRLLLGDGSAGLPVSTSEPAGDYGWPPLLAFGDFLAPNIHPAIDQAALAPEAAVAWVRQRAGAIARATGRPVLVKESGMPHGGRAGFSPERQRSFWEAWLAAGRLTAIDAPLGFVSYAVAFEAFDAPWKAEQMRDPMEGQWGLMTAERRPHPAFETWVTTAEAR